MADLQIFTALLERVRAGDPDAAREIVASYETAIRVAIRTRMSDPALRRQFDSLDVCQSVLGSFFLRMAAGLYDLNEPNQLIALLTTMARKKLAMRVRYERRQCRDVRRAISLDDTTLEPSGRFVDPSEEAMNSELIQRAYSMMDAETQEILRHRNSNCSWPEVASRLGGTSEGRRKQYERALDRIAIKLGIDEDPDELSQQF
ncbi:MAG: hypothetical protein KDB00_01065 [Planctomycetales bacterium]|nr:hypothetical protein [Planctomycetales bacterium]